MVSNKLNNIKLIIFDLDDCLIDTWGASFPLTIEKAIQAMIDQGLNVDSFTEAVDKLSNINNHSNNCSHAITLYLNEIGKYLDIYLDAGRSAIYNFNFNGKIKPLPGTLETLEILEKLGINLVIITKGEEELQIKKIFAAGINPAKFKKIIAVADYDKTEPYLKILSELNCSPKETLVVGDRYKTDLIPAINLGINTAWIPWGRGKINPPANGEVDYKLENLKDLLEIIKN